MRKFFSFMLWATLALAIFGFTFSDSVLDYLDDIGWDILFGYGSSDRISVDSIDSDSISIESTVLQDEFDDIISDYTLMYGEYPLIDVLDDPSLLDYSREKAFENLDLVWDTTFTMELTTSDSIDEDKVYYVVAVPKDDAWSLWEVSNEICFRLVDQIYWEWDECENTDVSAWSHWAWADMNLAGVSHTINWDTVTLRWISLDGSDEIEIFLRDEDAWTFNKLASVGMDDESYSFNIDNNGEHIVKFIPDNGGVEKNYSFNAMWVDTPDDPTPVVTPVVVWPKENIIAILIGTILIYLVYRVVKSKRKA